jgi:hypothetical protein
MMYIYSIQYLRIAAAHIYFGVLAFEAAAVCAFVPGIGTLTVSGSDGNEVTRTSSMANYFC